MLLTFSVAILSRRNNSSVKDVAKLGKNVNENLAIYIFAETLQKKEEEGKGWLKTLLRQDIKSGANAKVAYSQEDAT